MHGNKSFAWQFFILSLCQLSDITVLSLRFYICTQHIVHHHHSPPSIQNCSFLNSVTRCTCVTSMDVLLHFLSLSTQPYTIRCYNNTFCRHKDRVTDANKLQSIEQPLGLQSCSKGLDNKMRYKPTTPLWLPLAMAGCSHVHHEGVIQAIHAWCRAL